MGRSEMPELHECIYCRRRLPSDEFNREHVLSQAFGHFKDTLVLHDTVCWDCNSYFDKQLEVRFTRGAVETLLRIDTGLKEVPKDPIKLRFVEVTFPPGHDWHGVRLGVRMEDKLRIHLFRQAAFLEKATSRWVYLTSYELEHGALADQSRFDLANTRIFGSSESERAAMLSQLADLGITFNNTKDIETTSGPFDGRDLEVEITFTVNKGIRRCVAKYVFNYLAHECGRRFVLGTDFDGIRRFIRYGEVTGTDLVLENKNLNTREWFNGDADEPKTHALSVCWGQNDSVIGWVSLFGCMSYTILLAQRYRSLWMRYRAAIITT